MEGLWEVKKQEEYMKRLADLSLISFIVIVFFSACGGPKIFKLGSNYGGIAVNKEPVAINNAVIPVKAVSSTTQSGSTISFQKTFKFKGQTLQTGIDYVNHRQRLTYLDTLQAFDGRRSFDLHQFRVPLLYNITLFRDFDQVSTFLIHVGLSVGFTLNDGISDELRRGLPDYTLNKFDIGPQIGVTLQPLQLDYDHYLGLYLDYYRGTRIYEDAYHKGKGLGSLSFLKIGALLYIK
jgi:hypothetical protein